MKSKLNSENRVIDFWKIVILFLNIFSLILIVFLIFTQFFLSFVAINGEKISAFTANLRYSDLHWSFNYFWASIFIYILGGIFFLFTFRGRFKRFHNYHLWFWIIGFIILIIFGTTLQDFAHRNPELGFNWKVKNVWGMMISFLIPIFLCLFYLLESLIISTGKDKLSNEKLKVIKKTMNLGGKEFKIIPQKFILWYFMLYLIFILVAQKFAGIGGVIGAVFIGWRVLKTVGHAEYKFSKKIILIAGYIIVGIIIAFIINMIL